MKVYLVRHGEPVGADLGKRYLGSTDEALSPEGRRQAGSIAGRLAELIGAKEVRIISSPLIRCRETALAIKERVSCGCIEIDRDLRELSLGAWDGRYVREIREEFPDEYMARGKDMWNYRTPGGETFAEAGERFRAAFGRITDRSSDDDVIIIVAHSGVMRAGLSLLTGIPFGEWMKMDLPYAGSLALEVKDNKIISAELPDGTGISVSGK